MKTVAQFRFALILVAVVALLSILLETPLLAQEAAAAEHHRLAIYWVG